MSFTVVNNYNDDLKDLNVDTVEKKIQTSRDFNTVECYMVNLNMLGVPNINDNNLNNSYKNQRIFNERKINSVDSKRKKKNSLIIEKTNFKFNSSKNKMKTLK